jgi:hypothetical protein
MFGIFVVTEVTYVSLACGKFKRAFKEHSTGLRLALPAVLTGILWRVERSEE